MNVQFKTPAQSSAAKSAHAKGGKDALEAVRHVLFRSMGADGVYARTAAYEAVVDALSALISRQREPGTEVLRFPPVMSRSQLEKSGYLKSFPHLLGCVSCLHGAESEIGAALEQFEAGGDWASALSAADLVLSPAACYPVYPLAASRGAVPSGGLLFDVASDCFRHEPSKDLDRLQSFRMREYVCIGAPAEVARFRERWIARAPAIAGQLGLPYRIEQASDPFFGRGGKLMAVSQVEQSLKFELVIPVRSADQPTACMSFNYHQDHFGTTWNIRTQGNEAHGLRRLRHRPACSGALRPARDRDGEMARLGARGARGLAQPSFRGAGRSRFYQRSATSNALEQDDFSSNRHPALALCLSMSFSQNRFPLLRDML